VTTAQKPHASNSQIEMLCRCGESYRRRYIEGEIIPPGIAMLKGTGLHRAAETNMRQKIDSHVDLPARDIVAAAVAAFEDQAHGGLTLTDEEVGRGTANVIGEAKDDVAELADVHARQQAPDYQPVMVEQQVRILLPNSPRDLLGIIDLADDKERVTDFKTSGRSKSQSEADTSVQLTIYAAGYHALLGRPPAEVRLDTAVQTKTGTRRQVLASSRDSGDFQALANRINAFNYAVQAGSFPPASPGAWNCSQKWCGFWHTCPYVNPRAGQRSQND
jgi:hypothetical protein